MLARTESKNADPRRKENDPEQQVLRWQQISGEVDARRIEVERESQQAAALLAEVQRQQERLHAEQARLEQEWHTLLAPMSNEPAPPDVLVPIRP